MKKGKFIVLEGGEGAGKGVCIEHLKELLKNRYDVIFTREPGGTEISEQIRNVLMHKSNTRTTPLTELFLFCAARAQHIDELIRPTLISGRNIISDKFDASTKAYQIYGRKRHDLFESLERLNKIAKTDIEPCAIIYLDVDPNIGLMRKRKSPDGILTRFDEEKIEFHKKVRNGYLTQYEKSKKESGPVWHLIETTNISEQEVKNRVWSIVKQILNIDHILKEVKND